MRAKQSSTASGIDRCSQPLTPLPLIRADSLLRNRIVLPPGPSPESAWGEGLLHDARNLMGAIGLYCDLLSMPDVLKPEHRHYAEELRLLGTRSGSLIQQLMQRQLFSLLAGVGPPETPGTGAPWQAGVARSLVLAKVRAAERGPVEGPVTMSSSVGLRSILERCSGLLSQVAAGRAIEISYGPAASVQVSVSEEAVERILVNLVCNSAAAMSGPGQPGGPADDAMGRAVRSTVMERIADGTEDETPGVIRIGVGLLINRLDDPRPWPLRRVRLTVEDSGCGMTAEQLERILSGLRALSRERHGIGLRVVRELVAASGGELRVMSVPEIGTQVQIEWPVTTVAREDAAGKGVASHRPATSSQLSGGFAEDDGMGTIC